MKLAFLIFASSASAAMGQVPPSDPELQLRLEAVAAAAQNQIEPGSPIKKIEAGPLSLTLHFATPEKADAETIRSTLKSVGTTICADANWSWLWSNGRCVSQPSIAAKDPGGC